MLNIIPYDLMKLLGWATATLVVLAASFHLMLTLNKRLLKIKEPSNGVVYIKKVLRKVIPIIRNYHMPIGITALFTGISHGYLLLRRFEVHTGYITWGFILLLGLSGMTMKIIKQGTNRNKIKRIHTTIMYTTVVIMAYHIIIMQ